MLNQRVVYSKLCIVLSRRLNECMSAGDFFFFFNFIDVSIKWDKVMVKMSNAANVRQVLLMLDNQNGCMNRAESHQANAAARLIESF